jgi:hypothetical protein
MTAASGRKCSPTAYSRRSPASSAFTAACGRQDGGRPVATIHHGEFTLSAPRIRPCATYRQDDAVEQEDQPERSQDRSGDQIVSFNRPSVSACLIVAISSDR